MSEQEDEDYDLHPPLSYNSQFHLDTRSCKPSNDRP